MSVSIIIRAKNEAALIGECLRKIADQDYPGPVETIVIDSGSRDKTVEIARSFAGVKVVEIPPSEFNYGETLNLGVRLATGEYVVALSAHCVPLDAGWLSALVAPLDRDPQIGGTFGRQEGWPQCDPYEQLMLSSTFRPIDHIQAGTAQHHYPIDATFSNANSCFRRDEALKVPFRKLPYAEDRIWASEMLSRGWLIAYCAKASVFHSHQLSVLGYYRLGRTEGRMRHLLKIPAWPHPPVWFGMMLVFQRFIRWYRIISSTNHKGRLSTLSIALATLGKEMAKDVGVFWGSKGY